MVLGQKPLQRTQFPPAPAGYVAGAGRGAAGVTTRGDLGPAAAGPAGAGLLGAPPRGGEGEAPQQEFDRTFGGDGGLLGRAGGGEYDEEDREADEVWEAVDARMADRRRGHREQRLKAEIEEFRANNPKITEQFADAKRKLASLTDDDWEAIPDVADRTIKKQKLEQFVPVSDTLLAKAAAERQAGASVVVDGAETPAGGSGARADLTAVGEGRGTILSTKLDRLSDSVTGQTVVDPKGYLTDMKSVQVSSTADIQDIKKARKLLQSVIQTNPGHAPGWIAAARLEADLGKLSVARAIISQGCKACPNNEEIWMHAVHLQSGDNAKKVITQGLERNPESVKLWAEAVRLETDVAVQQRVLRKGLERVPGSVRLWRSLVDLASPADALILLQRAVECCPQHVDLWLALAKLEDYGGARKVLNRARQTIPNEPLIWVTAAKLEEAHGNRKMVQKIVDRALASFRKARVAVSRDMWLGHAADAESSEPPSLETCRAIVRAAVGEGVEEADRVLTWSADADEHLGKGHVETARAILSHALEEFPTEVDLWAQAARLEKGRGLEGAVDAVLSRAVTQCPKAVALWLMGAKERWLRGDLDGAREVLGMAYEANPDSEEVQLAAFKLEFSSREYERARLLLQRAREAGGSERVWMKSAVVERQVGDADQERKLLAEGLEKFPASWKMWSMRGQLESRLGCLEAARAAYSEGLRRAPKSVALWLDFAWLEEKAGATSRARALLEQGRVRNPRNPDLWLAAVRLERRLESQAAAEALMAKALQDCPTSGQLWAEHVGMAPRPQRKRRSVDALKRCNNDPQIVAAVAQLFWSDNKVEKARSWFQRAVKLEPDNGDLWAALYRFEQAHGDADQRASVVVAGQQADPKHGQRWPGFSKAVENTHASFQDVLEKVAVDLESNPLQAPQQ